jgi:uncharacterized protein
MATSTREAAASNLKRHDTQAAMSPPRSVNWANAAPLALVAFAVVTFMLSMVNANWIDPRVAPVVLGVALMFGGATQLIAGFIELRNGNVFTGTLFASFGAFWLSYFATSSYFLHLVPRAETGHAIGLLLYAFAFFTVIMWLAAWRTDVVTIVALTFLLLTILALATGNYGGHSALVHWGGYLGLVTAALACYLGAAGICEYSYGQPVLPVWSLASR